MSDNAYVQRQYPLDDDFDLSDARKPEEVLRIDIHGHTSTKSMSVRYIESRPFYVYTRKEADEYIDSIRNAYNISIHDNPDGGGDGEDEGDEASSGEL